MIRAEYTYPGNFHGIARSRRKRAQLAIFDERSMKSESQFLFEAAFVRHLALLAGEVLERECAAYEPGASPAKVLAAIDTFLVLLKRWEALGAPEAKGLA